MKNIAVLVFVTISLAAQAQYHSATHNAIHFQNRPQGYVTALPALPPESKLSFYLTEAWMASNIYLKDSTKIEGVNIRIDLKDDLVEIQFNNGIKILPFKKILALTQRQVNGTQKQFLNGAYLRGAGSSWADQMIEVIQDGQVTLFCGYTVGVVRASARQNPMLESGQGEDRVVLKKHYMIGRGDTIIEIESRNKLRDDVTRVFGGEAQPWLRKTNPRNEEDLIALVRNLSQLPKS